VETGTPDALASSPILIRATVAFMGYSIKYNFILVNGLSSQNPKIVIDLKD